MTSEKYLLEEVQEAFTRQAAVFDFYQENNPILIWMRKQVRDHVISFLRPGDKILELNAGTGLDAVYFAEKGFNIHATDYSLGMLEKLKDKVIAHNLSDKITFEQCSFTELNKVNAGKFDYIFSNFGGLNCIPDLTKVTRFFPHLLNNKGRITLAVMPPVCPWEILLATKGNFKTAFRRLRKNGTSAHIEGVYFKSYYHTPSDVIKALGKDFRKLKLQGVASFTPPPYMENFPKRFPRIFSLLNKLDESFCNYFPWNNFGDFFITTVEYSETS
jgi:ubiquinone/menaquinone biosynthesis C-methylase UbiE